MNIQIVMFRTLGDVLEMSPILRKIRQLYPEAEIIFHVGAAYAGVAKLLGIANRIIPHNKASYLSVYETWKPSSPNYAGKPDLFMPCAMATQDDTCWHHNPETMNFHMIDYYAYKAGLDVPLEDKHIEVQETEEAKAQAADILRGIEKPIVFHTTTLLETKDWPVQYFNMLAHELAKGGFTPVQVGADKDKIISLPSAINILGRNDLALTYSVIKRGLFYVGVDSGCAYLAEAAGIPSFIIMGSTSGYKPGRLGPMVGPVGSNVHYIEPLVRPDPVQCGPTGCVSHCPLKQGPCIETIDFTRVLEVIRQTLHLNAF